MDHPQIGAYAVEHLTQQRDGHALLFTFISVLTVAPLLYARLPFDPAEIAPVSIGVVLVHKSGSAPSSRPAPGVEGRPPTSG